MTPEGAQKVAIYTDEHGIGDVNFRPGSGFWFDALLATQPDLGGNLNGGCDLKYLKDNVLGHAEHHGRVPLPEPAGLRPAGRLRDHHQDGEVAVREVPGRVPEGHHRRAAQRPHRRGARAGHRWLAVRQRGRVLLEHERRAASCRRSCPVTEQPGQAGRAVQPRGHAPRGRPDQLAETPSASASAPTQYGNASIEVLESQGAEINIIGDFMAERLLRDVKVPFGEGTPSVIDPGIPPRAPGATPDTPAGPPAPNANGNTHAVGRDAGSTGQGQRAGVLLAHPSGREGRRSGSPAW